MVITLDYLMIKPACWLTDELQTICVIMFAQFCKCCIHFQNNNMMIFNSWRVGLVSHSTHYPLGYTPKLQYCYMIQYYCVCAAVRITIQIGHWNDHIPTHDSKVVIQSHINHNHNILLHMKLRSLYYITRAISIANSTLHVPLWR